jgi:hypothetical protein
VPRFNGWLFSDIEMKMTPNQGIHRSAYNALGSGLFLGLVCGLVAGLGLGGGLVFGLGIGVGSGLIGGLYFGGRSVLQHYILRWMLYRNGFLPLRLIPFLDYCAERIFLRKVGGGYVFVHRLLMEHFASLYSESTQPAAPPK